MKEISSFIVIFSLFASFRILESILPRKEHDECYTLSKGPVVYVQCLEVYSVLEPVVIGLY